MKIENITDSKASNSSSLEETINIGELKNLR
jgi:hypothetical protein